MIFLNVPTATCGAFWSSSIPKATQPRMPQNQLMLQMRGHMLSNTPQMQKALMTGLFARQRTSANVNVVEAAGFEPASESTLHTVLHT